MSKVRDFNLLKVADVSSNSTTTNSVSVVVNSTGSNQQDNDTNFTQANLFPSVTNQVSSEGVTYPPPSSESSQHVQQIQELQSQLENFQNELRFYQLLSSTLSNILKDNNPKMLINLIDMSGKIIIEATTLIELIAIKTGVDKNSVNISYRDEETGCFAKVSLIKEISNIKIKNETFSLRYNAAYNVIQDDFNISLTRCIMPISYQ